MRRSRLPCSRRLSPSPCDLSSCTFRYISLASRAHPAHVQRQLPSPCRIAQQAPPEPLLSKTVSPIRRAFLLPLSFFRASACCWPVPTSLGIVGLDMYLFCRRGALGTTVSSEDYCASDEISPLTVRLIYEDSVKLCSIVLQ